MDSKYKDPPSSFEKLTPHNPEKITLQFAELYKSPEWQNLDEIDRAQLLLVAEGVKPGTIIGGNAVNFLKVLDKLGLVSKLNTKPLHFARVYMVSSAEKLSEYFEQIFLAPENINSDFFHYANGEFLGYPKCCTQEYCNPQKNLGERKNISPHEFISNVDYEIGLSIDRAGTYPAELDYCPPSFTPCSASCEDATQLLKKWMSVLKSGDPKAARELQIFNWDDSPTMRIHQKEYDEIESERNLKWQIGRLRKSIQDIIRVENKEEKIH